MVTPVVSQKGCDMDELLELINSVQQVPLQVPPGAVKDAIGFVFESGKPRLLSKVPKGAKGRPRTMAGAVPYVALISIADLALLMKLKANPQLLVQLQSE